VSVYPWFFYPEETNFLGCRNECYHGLTLPKNELLTTLSRWDVEHTSRPGKRYICVGTGIKDTNNASSETSSIGGITTGRVLIFSLKPRDMKDDDVVFFSVTGVQ
jgi:hypothetical protein